MVTAVRQLDEEPVCTQCAILLQVSIILDKEKLKLIFGTVPSFEALKNEAKVHTCFAKTMMLK